MKVNILILLIGIIQFGTIKGQDKDVKDALLKMLGVPAHCLPGQPGPQGPSGPTGQTGQPVQPGQSGQQDQTLMCFDTRYFALMNPEFEKTMVHFFFNPPPGLAPPEIRQEKPKPNWNGSFPKPGELDHLSQAAKIAETMHNFGVQL